MLRDVGGVGQQGSVKELSDGYALNFLIPRGLAMQATAESLKKHEATLAVTAAKKQAEAEKLEKAIQSLEGKRIEIAARATEKGGLFKAITAKEIAGAIESKTGMIVPFDIVKLSQIIKQVGEYTVVLSGGQSQAHVMIKVLAA